MDELNSKDNELDELIKRIRFKPLQYDVSSNYGRLLSQLQSSDMSSVRSISPLWRWISVAASIALIVISTLYFNHQSDHMTWYEITAVPDAKTKIILPDSSTVWLNANASLHYPRSFDGDYRKVDISGETFFQVRKDDKPFVVDLGGIFIKVLGTSFNINADKENGKYIISLIEGKIALYDSCMLGEPRKIMLPNDQVVFYIADRSLEVSSVHPEGVTSWITRVFHFNNVELGEIVLELERAFHVKIRIEDDIMRKKTFNAIFENKETLDEILAIIQISAKYSIKREKGVIYLK